jgi:RHS repeat-associated protein
MGMPGRKYSASSSSYRYGFNGKENDSEVKGQGNQQDYGMRIYDPRLGKFLSVDPLQEEYPELTPYQFASNNPIQNIDLDGLEGSDYKGRITNATPSQRDNAPVWSFFRDLSAEILNYTTPAGAIDDAIDTWRNPNSTRNENINAGLQVFTAPTLGRGPRRAPTGGLHVEPESPKTPLKGQVKPVTEKPTQATPVNAIDKQATQANGKNTGAADANTQRGWTYEVFTGEKKLPINKNSK